ncbi:MAG: DUF1638 domain-containing protein [Candidatus Omnitrophica bacterium]|nr:DUF1638 domain-containing protein [Candidatus Omnitrophota bacterium]
MNDTDRQRERSYKLISCEIFFREMCAAVSRSPNRIDIQFLPKGLHDIGSKEMSSRLQVAVDSVESGPYEAILLGYGLCNNGLNGLIARDLPLVLPRAHDCITLFMGSSDRYIEYFNNNPGVYFETTGWLERGKGLLQLQDLSVQNKFGMDLSYEDLVAKYGEDNAKYLFEELHGNERGYQRIAFIEMGVEPDDRFEDRAKKEAKDKGWGYEKIQGDLSMIERLVDGDWNDTEFLVVPPGHKITAHYGEGLIAAEKIEEKGS